MAATAVVEGGSEIRSSLGYALPPIEEQQRWVSEITRGAVRGTLGHLVMRDAVISPVTGCLVLPERSRGPGGYSRTAISEVAARLLTAHSTGVHRASYFFGSDHHGQGRLFADPGELAMHVDHVCRNTGCMHGNHLQPATNQQNNIMKLQAKGLEDALAGGQLFSPLGLPWLERLVRECPDQLERTTITTRYGAFRLLSADDRGDALFAERINCEVLDRLKSPRPYQHRRRKIAQVTGQMALTDSVR